MVDGCHQAPPWVRLHPRVTLMEADHETPADSARHRVGESPETNRTFGERVRTRTTVAVTALLLVSSALGLLRDLTLAGFFGASGDTDAFLVAWTIPETVTVLLMEGAMSFLMVPVFVKALTRRGSVTPIIRATLLPLLVMLGLLTALSVVAAPVLIDLLAPGIADRALAIRCFRVAGSTVLFMGLAGYLMAAQRAHHRFIAPASIYVAYNVGILATMFALHTRLGVFSAALGLAVGSALMVVVLVPGFVRVSPLSGLRLTFDRRLLLAATAFIPTAAYSLSRQAQVFVERIVGSTLDPGSISYVNFASKVAQMPMLIAVTILTLSFPALARIAADPDALRGRVDQELRRMVLLILPAIAFLIVFAEPSVRLLYQRGAFDTSDTVATADVMRVYSAGLLGQVLLGAGTIVCFSRGNRNWIPAVSTAIGLVVTIVLDVTLVHLFGVVALAIGNAVGVSVSALLLMGGMRRRVVRFGTRDLRRVLLIATVAAFASAGAGWLLSRTFSSSIMEVLVGGSLTVGLFLVLTAASGLEESRVVGHAMRKAVGQAAAGLRGRRT